MSLASRFSLLPYASAWLPSARLASLLFHTLVFHRFGQRFHRCPEDLGDACEAQQEGAPLPALDHRKVRRADAGPIGKIYLGQFHVSTPRSDVQAQTAKKPVSFSCQWPDPVWSVGFRVSFSAVSKPSLAEFRIRSQARRAFK